MSRGAVRIATHMLLVSICIHPNMPTYRELVRL